MTVTLSRAERGRIAAWASWDWGSAAFNAVITTFVFTTYLVSPTFQQPAASATAAKAHLVSGLSLGLAIAGLVVALVAPIVGRRSDALGHRRRNLGIGTGLLVLTMVAMFFVVGSPPYFVLGVTLVALGTVFYEVASVDYNAMLPGITTRRNVGRVSAVGWASGYFGGIVLLIAVLVLFVGLPDPLVRLPTGDGLDIRVIALCCAAWTVVFGVPVLLRVPEAPAAGGPTGVLATYADVGRHVARLWRTDRTVLRFLLASAVFRDGLTGVFTYGGVIAQTVFGFPTTSVLLFGVAANVVAGLSTVVSGRFDDRFGPKRVVLGALVGLVVAGSVVFLGRGGGPAVFWVAGLVLCLFVGPAQSASRSMLARMVEPSREGELFGLYATTGRAAIFLAPALYGLFAGIAGDSAFGVLGILLVLLVGLVLLLPVRAGGRPDLTVAEPLAR